VMRIVHGVDLQIFGCGSRNPEGCCANALMWR
jgi:hypothetical protein